MGPPHRRRSENSPKRAISGTISRVQTAHCMPNEGPIAQCNSAGGDLPITLSVAEAANLLGLRVARRHWDALREGSGTAEDIIEIVPTGNLPRGTPKDPIHSVGVVVIVVRGDADRSRGEDPLR